MALCVFRAVWRNQKDAVLLACQMLEECSVQDKEQTSDMREAFQVQVARLEQKQEGLRGMCAMGDITREEFLRDNQKIQAEIHQLQERIDDLAKASACPSLGLDMAEIKRTLNRWVDFSGPTISEELIDQFILQVVVVDEDTFNWTLDLSSHSAGERRPRPSEIALQQYRERHSSLDSDSAPVDTILSRHIIDPQTILSIQVTREEAETYCHSIGMKFFGKKWRDKTILISI